MNHTHTNAHEVGDNGTFNSLISEAYPRGEAEHLASREILRLIDKHGTVTRQLVAQELHRHGVCLLRDVLRGMQDMGLVEAVAGGTFRRPPLLPNASGRHSRPTRRPETSDSSTPCEHFI